MTTSSLSTHRVIMDRAIMRGYLFDVDYQKGYIVGPTLYNTLGLSTSLAMIITVATTQAFVENQITNHKGLRVRLVSAITGSKPLREQDIILLQYLDVLANCYPSFNIEMHRDAWNIMSSLIMTLTPTQLSVMITLAIKYYDKDMVSDIKFLKRGVAPRRI